MKNITLIVGARPNFMKAYPVYESLKNDFNLTLIHTGQHFDEKMSKVFFEQLKFPKPDIHLSLEKKTKAGEFDDKLYVNNDDYLKNKDKVVEELLSYDGELGQLGEIRDKLKIEFEKIKPDLLIVFGDVTSTLAASLSAKSLNIDIAHVESGLRSGDMKMPEEVNRILTDHITKYYFVTEQSGVDNLKALGIREHVYLVGNTMIDTQKKYLQQALDTNYHKTLDVKSKDYVLITLHRPSNVDDISKLREIFDDLEKLSKSETLVYLIHPRTKNNLEKVGYLEKVENNKNIILLEPLGYLEFTCLMANCKYVVTDSGGLQEESTALDIPCFTLRENTERPSTLIENNGTNQLIHKISEIELKECKSSMKLWDGKSSESINKIISHNISKLEKIIINLNGQLKYIHLTYKYWNEFKLINNAKLVITTEQIVKYKNGDTQEITEDYLKSIGLNYDILYIFTKNDIKNFQKDDQKIYEKVKYYYKNDIKNILIRTLARPKQFEFFLKKYPEFNNYKIAYMRSDFMICELDKNLKNGTYSTNSLKKIIPGCINTLENVRISDYFMYGNYEDILNFFAIYRQMYGHFFSMSNFDQDKLISPEAQFNQSVKYLIRNTNIKFVDLRDFKNNLVSINYYYDESKKETLYRVFGVNKLNNTYYENININSENITTLSQLFLNYYNLSNFKHNEIWNRHRVNKETQYTWFNNYSDMLYYINNNSDHFEDLIIEKNNKLSIQNNSKIITLVDLHRTNYENLKKFMLDVNEKIIFCKYLPFWFINIWNDLFKGYVIPKVILYPAYIWKFKKNYNKHMSSNKPIDILIYGAYTSSISPDITSEKYLAKQNYINFNLYYELRHRLITKIIKDEKLKDINIKFVQPSDNIRGDNLNKLVSQSKFTIATCANVLYLVEKYFEIPLNNSIIIGNIPEYAPNKMKENIINIKNSMSDDEIIEILIDSVKNYENHKSKQLLGKYLYEMSEIISENDYLKDTYIYHYSGVKTKRLEMFENKYNYEISEIYNNEY